MTSASSGCKKAEMSKGELFPSMDLRRIQYGTVKSRGDSDSRQLTVICGVADAFEQASRARSRDFVHDAPER